MTNIKVNKELVCSQEFFRAEEVSDNWGTNFWQL